MDKGLLFDFDPRICTGTNPWVIYPNMDMVCITSTHAWNEFSASVILPIASNANDNTYCNENNSVVAQTQQSGLLTLLKLIDVYQSKSPNCRLIMNWIIIVRLSV